MSATLAVPSALATAAHEPYVVSHGKSGAVGVFTPIEPLLLRRGQAVLVQSSRGIEIGKVLCPATQQQARLLGATSAGSLLRPLTGDDAARQDELIQSEQQIFETSRAWAQSNDLPLEILDVELLYDGRHAIVQFVGPETETEQLAQALEQQFPLTVRLENLAVAASGENHEHGGCGKPDCGRTTTGGGCTTCSTGGGCSSCGAGQVDLREYFGHLRTKIETRQRIPLT